MCGAYITDDVTFNSTARVLVLGSTCILFSPISLSYRNVSLMANCKREIQTYREWFSGFDFLVCFLAWSRGESNGPPLCTPSIRKTFIIKVVKHQNTKDVTWNSTRRSTGYFLLWSQCLTKLVTSTGLSAMAAMAFPSSAVRHSPHSVARGKETSKITRWTGLRRINIDTHQVIRECLIYKLRDARPGSSI